MNLEQKHIKEKRIVGELPNGQPVFYIETHGGLHVMLGNPSGKIEVLAAMPHFAMAKWLTEKKIPNIKWDEESLKA